MAAQAGFFAALKTLLATLVATGRTRLELLSVEFAEEKLRLLDLMISGLAAVFFAALAIVLGVTFLAAAFWEQRLVVFGGATLLMLLAAMFCIFRLRSLTASPPKLFRSSLAELDKDLDALRSTPPEQP